MTSKPAPAPRSGFASASVQVGGGSHPSRRRAGFTLVELLVTIGIIALLISLLIPAVARVRRAAQTTSTQALLTRIQAAIERYQQEFNAYPGPLPDRNPGGGNPYVGGPFFSAAQIISPVPTGFDVTTYKTTTPPNTAPLVSATLDFNSITGTQNLVLGLLGGLYTDTSVNPPVVKYNPALVGNGPSSLNPAAPRTSIPYLDAVPLSWRNLPTGKTGLYRYNEATDANDSPIPSLLDTYPDAMPLLFLRARISSTGVATFGGNAGQYDLRHVMGYTTAPIGSPASLKVGTAKLDRSRAPANAHGLRTVETDGTFEFPAPAGKTYYYPYDLAVYAGNPSLAGTPRNKDAYLLISAGPDRIYGTQDDITNFGQVAP